MNLETKKRFGLAIAMNVAILLFYAVFSDSNTSFSSEDFLASTLPQTTKEIRPEELVVAQADEISTLDPTILAPSDEVVIALSYEPLIRFDEFFNLKPALAYTWYYRTDTDLVVELRDAKFHDGEKINCRDVTATLDRAKNFEQSGIADFFASVDVFEEAEQTCVFRADQPDFNLLRKLTQLYILPAATAEKFATTPVEEVIGTGRYQLVANEEGQLQFERFEDYYFFEKKLPAKITLKSEPKKYNRLGLLKSSEADILLDVPASFAEQVESRYGYVVEQVPTYESVFMLFNFKNQTLAKDDTRELIQQAIWGGETLSEIIADGSVYEIKQFAPSGVFGFSPDLIDAEIGFVEPATEKQFFTLATTAANVTLAQSIQTSLALKNIELSILTLTDAEFVENFEKGRSDLYLTGWQFELGMVDDFFTKMIDAGKAGKNNLGYKNIELNKKISAALAENDTAKRLELWQQAALTITTEDRIGTPLLGLRRLYAVKNGFKLFKPRMDGLLIFDTDVLN